MSRASDLDLALDNVAAVLASVTASPKPTYNVDGEQMSWMEYTQMLIVQLAELEKARLRADGPFEVVSRGF